MSRVLPLPGRAHTIMVSVLVVLAGPAGARAQGTTIGGRITTNTALRLTSSPYRVTSTLTVDQGAVLTIEPGVTVRVDGGVDIVVTNGSLDARGTKDAPIVITSSKDDGADVPAAGDWGVLRFEDATQDGSTQLRHLELRYGIGVVLVSASPRIDHVAFRTMSGPALSIDLASFPEGTGNSAQGCGLNGILVPAGEIVAPNARWALRGLPYVVRGQISVGVSPQVTSVEPSAVPQLDSAAVTFRGRRLNGATAVEVEGHGVTATIDDASHGSELSTHLDVAEDAAVGDRRFTVVTPAGRVDSREIGLQITITAATPLIDTIVPGDVAAGRPAFTLTVNGRRYATAAEVVLGKVPLPTTRVSSMQLTSIVPPDLVAQPGDVPVVVRQPDAGSPGSYKTSNMVPLHVSAGGFVATDSVSRAFSVRNDITPALQAADAASRAFSVRNDLTPALESADAVSRGFSVRNDLTPELTATDTVSRAFSVRNDLTPALTASDARSRAFTVINELTPSLQFASAASRSFTVRNDLAPTAAPSDAISRAFTVNNDLTSRVAPPSAASRSSTAINDLFTPISFKDAVSRIFSINNQTSTPAPESSAP